MSAAGGESDATPGCSGSTLSRPPASPRARLGRALILSALVSVAVAVLLAFVLPVYSSGKALADDGDSLLYPALVLAALLACMPYFVSAPGRRVAALACGGLLILSSFVSVLGVFFIPAGLLLCLAGMFGEFGRAAD